MFRIGALLLFGIFNIYRGRIGHRARCYLETHRMLDRINRKRGEVLLALRMLLLSRRPSHFDNTAGALGFDFVRVRLLLQLPLPLGLIANVAL